jgi:hypothetical protein
MARQKVVEYSGQKEVNKGNEKMQKDGWWIVSISEVKQPVGIKRIAAIGIGALVVKPKPHFFVTYQRGS